MTRMILSALLIAATLAPAAHAQLGTTLKPDPIPARSVMGNGKDVEAVPTALPLPDCKPAVEALTVMGGVFSCVSLPAGGGATFTVSNGLKLENGVLSLEYVTVDKSAGPYQVAATDSVKTLLVGAFPYSVPQAGSPGFGDGWTMCFDNKTETSTATLITATSKFVGAPGEASSRMNLAPKQMACLVSWKGDWNTVVLR